MTGEQQQYQQAPPQGGQYSQQPPQYGAPQYDGNGNGSIEGKQSFDETFKIDRPKYNDVWAGILLIIMFCGFVAIFGICVDGYTYSGLTFAPNKSTMGLFGAVLAVALVLSWAYFLSAKAFTKQFIWITGILNIALALATAIYYLWAHIYYAGIVFLVFAVFALVCFISWIPRIPFSSLMLRTAMDVATNVGHVFLISFIGGVLSVVFAAWFAVTLVAVYAKYQPSSSEGPDSSRSSSKVIGLLVVVTFASYWISEWLKSTIHTIVAGVYGSWFFCSNSPGGIPKGITRGAARRALTYSFGSISFGSLVVAIINALRQLAAIARQQQAEQGNIIGYAIFCVLGCFISLLDWIVQFINRYAFIHIALYGKAYIPAAKDTWLMMKDRGIDALVNDCLIGPVISMGAIFVAYASALVAWLYLHYTDPAYNSDNAFTPAIMAFAFIIGGQICQIFMTPIASGVDTIFVAAAWDPDVLVRDHPDLYARMMALYPHIQAAIHA